MTAPLTLRILYRSIVFCLFACFAVLMGSNPLLASQRYSAIALYGEPRYLPGAAALDFSSNKSVKGGRIVLPAFGSYDTLNPYALKGVSLTFATDQRMWGIDALNETLMAGGNEYLPSPDEAQTAYCLICSYVEFDNEYRQVSFGIRPDARFHDGTPITANDVHASYTLLTSDSAHPRFSDIYRDIESVTVESANRITFALKPGAGRQMVFRLGELPVMSASFWKNRDFGATLNEPPLLSGPYRICEFHFGRSIDLCRVDNFWSKNHFYYRNQFNFDRLSYEFFRDRTVAFEAFKSGKLSAWVEYVAKNWATAYDFPAMRNGALKKQQIPHQIPTTYQYFALNLRRAPFNNIEFRKALTLAFDFEWTNKYLFNDAYFRANTYFPNSSAGARNLPSPEERALLLKAGVPESHPMFSEVFQLPRTTGNGNPRPQLKEAMRLLKQAGFTLDKDQLYAPDGTAVRFEFLVDHASMARVIQPYLRNLQKIGIHATLRSVDETQFKSRLDKFDYDVTVATLPQSQIPTYDLRLFFHSSQAGRNASYNYSGIQNNEVDQLLESLDGAQSLAEILTTTAALDRVLLWNYFTIPQWYLGHHRIAYDAKLHRPDQTPPYSLGFSGWWLQQEQDEQ